MSILDTIPRDTQAAILNRVAGEKHPKLALGNIAHHYKVTLADLQTLLNRYGYPDVARMRRAAADLEQPAENIPTDIPAHDVQATDSGTLTTVKVRDLYADPDNPREDLTDIEELAESMTSVGLLQPIVARQHDGKLYVVAGHRRLAAAKHLSWTSVPCIVRAQMRPDHVLAAMLIENGHRADLDAIEEARGLHRLKTLDDLSDAELARKVGRTQAYVSGRLALLALSAEEQAQVRAGALGITVAIQKGRVDSGRVRPGAKGKPSPAHLSIHHSLGARAQARFTQLGHSRGRGKGVGGIACGECWESVIRADEREQLHARSAKDGDCALCSAPIHPRAVTA